MGKFEQQAIDNSLLKPLIWRSFIDDIFMIWTHGEEYLKSFIDFLNSIHPSIKFTHEYSNSLHQTLPFLDVQVHLINNHIETDLHTKPTNKHQYLLKTSCHPNHTKKVIPFSLFLRIRRLCSTETFFDQRSRELIEYLIKRGYVPVNSKTAHPPRAIPGHLTRVKLRTVGNLTQNEAHPVEHLTFVSKRLSAVGSKRISQFFDSAGEPPSR